MEYGYVRVSTKEQNEERQMIALAEAGIIADNIFVDKQSGKDFERRAYGKLLACIRTGDVIFVKSIDRLGRNYEDILEQWRYLTKEKMVDLVILDNPLLDTRYGKDLIGTFLSDIVLQVLSFVAENERENIRQRQAEGIAAAKARGVRFGRPEMVLPEEFWYDVHKWKQGNLPRQEILDKYEMSGATFYRKVRHRQTSQSDSKSIPFESDIHISL